MITDNINKLSFLTIMVDVEVNHYLWLQRAVRFWATFHSFHLIEAWIHQEDWRIPTAVYCATPNYIYLICSRLWIPAHTTKSRIMSCNVAPARNAGVCRHCQVPLGCLKTAFVTQGLGSREFVKTMEVSIIFLLPERRKVSCWLYEIHSKANLLWNGYLSPKTWKKLILTYYILSCVCLRWYMPSSPLNIAIAMAPVLSSKVSSCTSTSALSQDSFRNPRAGKPRQWTWV